MTKPIVTLRRGNGGIRLNKVEKPDDGALVGDNPRCGWMEGGQAACMWRGRLVEGLCAEHRSEMLRVARVRRWQEGRSRTALPTDSLPDHSAPWRCQIGEACGVCAGKPDYKGWVDGRADN